MDYLPSLVFGASVLRLPLSTSVAEVLTDCIAARDPASLESAVRAALRQDPAFALWAATAERLQYPPTCCGKTTGALAAWFMRRLTVDFAAASLTITRQQAVVDEPVNTPRRPILWWSGSPYHSAAGSEPFAQLATESLAIARLATAAVDTDETLDPEEIHLAALLHNAAEWGAAAVVGPRWPRHLLPPQEHPVIHQALQTRAGELAAIAKASEVNLLEQGATDDDSVTDERNAELAELAYDAAQQAIESGPDYAGSPAGRRLPELAARLHRYSHLEREYRRSLETEKLAALGELAAGAGHEINNPLAVISGRVQLLLRDEQEPARRQQLATVKAQALRVHEMISDLMLFARPPRPRPQRVDLVQVAESLVAEVTAEAERREVTIRLLTDVESLLIEADPRQVGIAVRALLDNALQAIGSQGNIEIYLRPAWQTATSGRRQRVAMIDVSDTGPGIPPEVRRHVFDPFYSGRSAGRGLGFGLTKCWRIVTLHGGHVEVDCGVGTGAKFTIRWPLKQPLGAAA